MTETLEQRAARLSIGIGAKVAEVGNAELREALLEDALVEVLEDLIRSHGLLVVGAEYSLETGVVDFFDGLPPD